MEKILIIEDEENIRSFILINLKRYGYSVLEAESGEMGLQLLREHHDISLILLDIMMPGIDGFQVCKQIRETNQQIGIIMLTAKTMELDKVQGLLNGADDYVAKPFSPNELIARIQSLLRRIHIQTKDKMKGLSLDRAQRCLIKDEKKIELSPTEYDILSLLDMAKGEAISRHDILDEVWGVNYLGDPKIVDVNIRRIRRKVEINPSEPDFIQTIWGFGYKWVKE
ncbi:response regulator transcription factor [Bacillus sp. FJAT-50079]|uniref:response regulator transcription factor n=1 Tax=Bacillus sp. FJAT-50079 TaxID=2833577 RepID=UPI001BC96997|nr:response regulator transcription factor [Bacillus sp. FJAT-50079]MBS4209302.1 response regulator transcription factor [Bacillus sp. FJAT-50079]